MFPSGNFKVALDGKNIEKDYRQLVNPIFSPPHLRKNIVETV